MCTSLLDGMKSAVKKRAELMQKQICALKAPYQVTEKDINAIVFQTMSMELKDFRNVHRCPDEVQGRQQGRDLEAQRAEHGRIHHGSVARRSRAAYFLSSISSTG